jgi:hypothetical protein
MARISAVELQKLGDFEKESLSRAKEYQDFKKSSNIPDKNDPAGCGIAVQYLKELFFEKKFNLFDVVTGERGFLLASENDTHYRGRVFESALNGLSTGSSKSDFAYAELKLIETKPQDSTKLDQFMTCGVIFSKSKGTYEVVDDYYESNFFKKLNTTIVVSYFKEGKQLGRIVNNVVVLDLNDAKWSQRLKEDWESIRDEMKLAIAEYERTGIRKTSGICKSDTSGARRPHGLLGIRSDSVGITSKFFTELVNG